MSEFECHVTEESTSIQQGGGEPEIKNREAPDDDSELTVDNTLYNAELETEEANKTEETSPIEGRNQTLSAAICPNDKPEELETTEAKEKDENSCTDDSNQITSVAKCSNDRPREDTGLTVQDFENRSDSGSKDYAMASEDKVTGGSNTEGVGLEPKDDSVNNETKKCEPCFFDDVTEDAVSFCVVCAEYMCKLCTRDHRRNRLTRSHKILDGDDLPDNSATFKQMKVIVSCSDHPESVISYKCDDHKRFICSDCIAVTHRKCEHVVEISKLLSAIDESRELVQKLLSEIHDLITSAQEFKENNMQQLQEDAASIEREREECVQVIKNHLDDLNEQLKNETNQLLHQETYLLAKEVRKCEDVAKEEKIQRELFKIASDFGSIQEQIVLYEELESKAKTLLKDCQSLSTKSRVSLQFKTKETKACLLSFGTVSVNKGQKDKEPSASQPQTSLDTTSDALEEEEDTSKKVVDAFQKEETSELPTKIPLMQSSVKKTRTMHEIKNDMTRLPCSVSAMVLLSDSRLIITDKTKKQIKLLDKDFAVMSTWSVNESPIDMCATNLDLVAVIFDKAKEVRKYRVSCNNGILFDGRFPTKLFPISVAGCQAGIAILFSDTTMDTAKNSDDDVIEVQIRSQNGHIYRTVSGYTSSSSRELVLKNPIRIFSINTLPEGYAILEEDKMHLFDDEMNEILFYKSYRDNILKDASDVAYDSEDNLYVCGKTSRNVHQISRKNYRVNRVLFSLPGNPTAMCVDSKRRLIITGCENDDFLYVTYFV